MSWFAKVSFFLALFLVSVAPAQRVYFSGRSSIDGVESRLVRDRGAMSSVEIRFSIPHMDINDATDGFANIAAPGVVPLEVPGLPALFSTGRLIAVPPGFEPEVELVDSQVKEFANVAVAPAQTKYRCDCDANRQFSFDAAAYASRSLYPVKQLVVEQVGKIQGMRLVRIGFYPAQYDFGTKTLRVTHAADIRVSFRQIADSLSPAVMTKPMFSLVRSTTVNGPALTPEVVRVETQEVMLVVSADALVEGLKPFVEWKTKKGMKVDVVNFTTAGGSKEKVKAYVKDYYEKAAVKPSYLLFVGNKDSMPAFKESTKSGAAATDFTFAILKADDKLPTIPYGRFLANNLDELKNVVSRSIDYEANPEKGADWYAKGAAIASDEGDDPSDKEYAEQIQAALKAGTYTTVDGFFQGEDTATFKNISGALKEGRSWLSYFGHGSGTSWGSTNDSFTNTQVAKLDNTRLPIIIDVACMNASWMSLDKPFGKAWTQQTADGKNAGAVAFYGGSVNISWHPPAIMSVGIAKTHFEKPVASLGGTVMAGQLYLIEKKGMTEDNLDNYKWYNLFGDPSLVLRTSMPKAYTVKAAMAENELRETVVVVSAVDMKGAPVSNVQASLTPEAGTAVVAKTGKDGMATINLGAQKLVTGTLTTTGYNLETVTQTIKP